MKYFIIMGLAPWLMILSPVMAEEAALHVLQRVDEPSTLNAPSVETVQPEKHDFFRVIPWFGQVLPTQSVTLMARVAGTVTSLEVEDGAIVKAGDELFVLGGREIESRRTDLKTRLQSTQQSLKLAQQDLNIRQSMLNGQLSSKEQVNTAKQAVAQATAQLSMIKQAVTAFDASLSIRASIRGNFTGRTVSVGQYVSVGSVLANIINLDHVRVQASLFPPAGVSPKGLQAVLGGALNKRERHGKVVRVLPDANAAGAVQVWIEGDELAGLLPGTPVSGELKGIPHLSLAVPASAIARNKQSEAFVFIRTSEGLRRQAIQTGLVDHDQVEILSGLTGGEWVVSKGAYELLHENFSKIYQEPD